MPKKSGKKTKRPVYHKHQVDDLFKSAYDLHNRGENVKAENLYRTIILLDPFHSNALNLLGTILMERGEYDTALSLIQRAVNAYPNGAIFHNNLGTVYRSTGKIQESEKAYRNALRIDPEYVEAHNNLGTILQEKGDMDGAIDSYVAAYRKNPGFSPAYYNLGRIFCEQGHIDASLWAYRQALGINPLFHEAWSNLLYTLHFSEKAGQEEIFEEHKKWAYNIARPLYPENFVYQNTQDPFRVLNIGYVSADFKTHSVAFFLEDVFARHDREMYRIHCYSNVMKGDGYTHRFKELADVWRDISRLSDHETAEMIRKDQIDILIDLGGHTGDSRIRVFAMKPAPVQVAWLGYPDTTGLDVMDYRLTDTVADPIGKNDHLYTESLYRLSGGFLCFRPSGESSPVAPSPFSRTGRITFGSFNNNSKISEGAVAAWARILRKVPWSRLKLKSRSFDDFGTRKHVLELFDNHGIMSERIWFEGYSVGLREHFLLYNTVDIALDTFPYNGTTTTCEALWMGVPVIALAGQNHVSRVGASVLINIGLEEYLAESTDQYVTKAVDLANDPEHLWKLRFELRNRMMNSSLMNPGVFTSSLERAYRDMWRKWIRERNEAGMDKTDFSKIQNNFFDINFAVLKKHYPGFEITQTSDAGLNMKVRFTETGVPNLYIKTPDGSASPIYIENNPLEDLEGLIEQLKMITGKVIMIFGGGLMIHAGPVVKAVGDVNLIVFFEAFPEMFVQAMKASDLTDVLSHPNVRIAVGDQADPYMLLESLEDKVFLNSGCKCIANKNIVALAPSWYEDKQKQFESYLTRKQVAQKAASYAGKTFLSNAMANLQKISESMPIHALDQKMKGLPAIIVASGPSLSINVHQLKEYQDKAVIIAADSAVSPLFKNGVKPHFIAVVDYNDFTYEKLAPFCHDLKESNLVFLSTATPKILNYIDVKHKFVAFPDKGNIDLLNKIFVGKFSIYEEVQSVIHLALLTAQIAGCNPIIFAGLDFAFSGVKDHADSTILHWGNTHLNNPDLLEAEGATEPKILTTHNFLSMLEVFEYMMNRFQEVKYIDATEGGIKKKGAEIMKLRTAGEIYCKDDINITIGDMVSGNNADLFNPVINQLNNLKKDVSAGISQIIYYEKEKKNVRDYMQNKRPEQIAIKNLPEKIVQSLRRMDSVSQSLDHDQSLSYLKGLLSESYDEYLSHEIKFRSEAVKEDTGHRLAASLEQQEFVQKIRKEALQSFLILIEEQLDYFETISGLTVKQQKEPFKLAEFYFEHDRLVEAENLFKERPNSPLMEYYSGCIDLKRGLIEKGKTAVAQAVEKDRGIELKAQQFYRELLDSWLEDKKLQSYRKICLDHAVRLSPDNPEVLRARETMIYYRILYLIEKKLMDSAMSEMMEADSVSPIKNIHINMIFAGCLFGKGKIDEGINYLLRIADNSVDNNEIVNCIKQNWLMIYGKIEFHPDLVWIKKLIFISGTDIRAHMILQGIWWIVFDGIESKIIRCQISQIKVQSIESELISWSELKDIIPEWHYFKALCEMSHGHESNVYLNLNKALDLPNHSLQYHQGEGHLRYVKGIVLLYFNKTEECLEILTDLYKDTQDGVIAQRILVGFLNVRMGMTEKAERVFEDIFKTNFSGLWEKGFADSYQNKSLINEMNDLSSLKVLSAWFFLIGKILMKEGYTESGVEYLRAAINIDPSSGRYIEKSMLKVPLIDQWISDTSKIEMNLHDGNIDAAEEMLDEWERTKTILPDFTILKSRIIEKKESIDKAVEFLVSCIEDERDNPEYLAYCSRIFLTNGLVEDAGYLIERAVRINKRYAFLWDEAGDMANELQNYTAALSCYEKCLMALPGRMDVLRKLGDIYKALGNMESAALAYEMVLKHKPEDLLVHERLSSIKKGDRTSS